MSTTIISANSQSSASATFGPNGASVNTDSTSTIAVEGAPKGTVDASASGDAQATVLGGNVALNADSQSQVDFHFKGYHPPAPPKICWPPVKLMPLYD
jgi:hypothetical protein